MVVVSNKAQTNSSSSPLSIAPSSEKTGSSLSFSALLHGAKNAKDDKVVQNGAIVLALGSEKETVSLKSVKTDSLLSLLKGESADVKEELQALELNPKVTANLSPAELKVLIKDAKQYLKDKIVSMEGFKKSDIEALPKTLKGLAQVATKLGIDVSKITLEEVKSTLKSTAITSQSDVKTETKEALRRETVELDKKIVPKTIKSPTLTSPNKQQVQEESKFQEQIKVDTKAQEPSKEIKTTPLFKAQASSEISTEQLVNAKTTSLEVKTPKQKADETLKLLLRGDKVTKSELNMTADFSVATAKVIAPTAATEATKNLESLLRGDQTENPSHGKLDGLNTPKSDSLEVKVNEAKQMTKYLSQDVKTAIEDYKAPFTRIKVQLNPQRLGEVDLTVVQRGKNLHISLSSNNTAINTLALNANDLKMQLSNNGINNATLNFSNTSQGEDGSAQGQQNHQNREQAHKEYNYFESEEINEELVSSLEIVVPHYA
jgi:flagellar hook-length control protein FliK